MRPNAWHVLAIVAAFVVLIAVVESARRALDRRSTRAANERASRDAARRLEDLKNRGFFG